MQRSGQMIVLFALMLVALLALTGLALDGARLYMARHRLQHALDGAALAAANQFRIGRTLDDIRQAARDFLEAQGFDVSQIQVYTCDDPGPYGAELCTDPRRKLVRVDTAVNVPMTFMRLLNWTEVSLSASTTGEAASVDLVLIIDNSESMAYDTRMVLASGNPIVCIPTGDPNPNPACPNPQKPHFCNPTDQCEPFRFVRQAALEFASRMYYPYDRVAVVSFHRQAITLIDLVNGNNLTAVQNAIRSIQVYDPSLSPDTDQCAGMYCSGGTCSPVPGQEPGVGVDPRPCPSSNVAGALLQAYNILSTQGRREEEGALWAIVLLSDASPNATDPASGLPFGLCPRYQNDNSAPDPTWYWYDPGQRPFCQDGNFEERHSSAHSWYDAEDVALDMLDFLKDAKVVIFSIGYGDRMHNLNVAPGGGRDPNLGEKFMRYAADYTDGDDQKACLVSGGDWFNPGATWKPLGESCSNYFYAPDASALQEIFREIARRIFTRINQ